MGRVRRLAEPNAGNPFIYSIDYTPWMRVKLALGIALLLPIRILLTLICVPMVLVLVTICSMGIKAGDHLKPWQKFLMTQVAPWVCRFWMFIFGYYRLPLKGKRASVKDAPITVIAPHANAADIGMLAVLAWGSPVSRKENEKIAVLGPSLKACETILVDRAAAAATPGGAGKDPHRGGAVEEMQKRLASPGLWIPIVMFPEGTMHNGESIIGFKTGAFRPGVPVQPLVLRYSQPMPGFWGQWGYSLPVVFLYMMSQWCNSIDAEYLPVYRPSDEERADTNLYANNVRRVMAKALDRPVTEYAYEDLGLLTAAEELGLPQSTAHVEYNLINKLFGVRLPELKAILSRFARIDAGKRGVVSRDDFLSYLQWPVAEHAGLLFDEYDTCSDCGELRFREYAVATLDLAVKVPDGEGIAAAAFKALSGGEEHMSVDSVLDYMQQQQGYGDVTKDGVQSFLYRVSESNELTADGFAAYVDANPDVKVLVFWLMNGTEQF